MAQFHPLLEVSRDHSFFQLLQMFRALIRSVGIIFLKECKANAPSLPFAVHRLQ